MHARGPSVVILVLAVALVGCGRDRAADRKGVAETVRLYYAADAARDARATCATLTDDGRRDQVDLTRDWAAKGIVEDASCETALNAEYREFADYETRAVRSARRRGDAGAARRAVAEARRERRTVGRYTRRTLREYPHPDRLGIEFAANFATIPYGVPGYDGIRLRREHGRWLIATVPRETATLR